MLPEHQIIDCNTDRNIFVWCNRDDTMDVKELKNVTADYKKVKVNQYQNGGTEKKSNSILWNRNNGSQCNNRNQKIKGIESRNVYKKSNKNKKSVQRKDKYIQA